MCNLISFFDNFYAACLIKGGVSYDCIFIDALIIGLDIIGVTSRVIYIYIPDNKPLPCKCVSKGAPLARAIINHNSIIKRSIQGLVY
jgi:hypothetical protein